MAKNEGIDEKIKELANRFRGVEAQNLLDVISETLKVYASFMEKFGTMQVKYGKAFEIFKDFSRTPISSEIINLVVDKASPEQAGMLLKISLKLNNITPQLSNFGNLSGEEKIELGRNLKTMAKDFEEMSVKGGKDSDC